VESASKIKKLLTTWLCALIVTLSLGETRAGDFFAVSQLESGQIAAVTLESTSDFYGASEYDASGYAVAPKTTPSAFARSQQGSGAYPGVDRFRDITLKKGTTIFGGAPGQSNFYTTASGVGRANGSSSSLFQGLQVGKAPAHIPAHPITGKYRPGVTAYEVTQDLPAAFGRTLNNPQFGRGGFPQIVIENYQDYLRPIYSTPLGK